MRAYDLIRSRRSVRAFEPRPLSREAVALCLEAAVWAPNRGLTQPWRFAALGGSSLRELAAQAAALEARRAPDPGQGVAGPLGQAAAAVAVWQTVAADAATGVADRLAVAAAVQNLLLCAWDEGWAGTWLGGPLLLDPGVQRLVRVAEGDALVAVVALGWPAEVPPLRPRRRVAELTRWAWDEA